MTSVFVFPPESFMARARASSSRLSVVRIVCLPLQIIATGIPDGKAARGGRRLALRRKGLAVQDGSALDRDRLEEPLHDEAAPLGVPDEAGHPVGRLGRVKL